MVSVLRSMHCHNLPDLHNCVALRNEEAVRVPPLYGERHRGQDVPGAEELQPACRGAQQRADPGGRTRHSA